MRHLRKRRHRHQQKIRGRHCILLSLYSLWFKVAPTAAATAVSYVWKMKNSSICKKNVNKKHKTSYDSWFYLTYYLYLSHLSLPFFIYQSNQCNNVIKCLHQKSSTTVQASCFVLMSVFLDEAQESSLSFDVALSEQNGLSLAHWAECRWPFSHLFLFPCGSDLKRLGHYSVKVRLWLSVVVFFKRWHLAWHIFFLLWQFIYYHFYTAEKVCVCW